MHIKHRQTCRVCGNKHLKDVVDLGEQFFQGSFVEKSSKAFPLRKTPNLVVRCDPSKDENACGLVQTKHSIPPEILYSNYWYQSGISFTMRNHLKNIVEKCLEITKLTSGKVLDIASNDSTLLRNYGKDFKKTGVDPSDIAAKQTDSDITIINETFPTKNLKEKEFDIITSIACFYDVEDPITFAANIKEILTPNGIWVFEVAYWPSILSNLMYDSIVNEHIIHYHLAPIEILLKKVGLKLFRAEKTTTNGESIMCFVAHESNAIYDSQESKRLLSELRMQEFEAKLDEEETYIRFRNNIENHKNELKNLIKQIINNNQIIHVYGASTKLNTILGYCDIGTNEIKYASERSPDKIGGKTLNGIELISEEDSLNMRPDYYLVGPYHFKEEILKRSDEAIKAGIKFIFPLPRIEVV